MANYFDNFLLSGDCCCLKGAMIVITFCCCRCCGCGSHGDRCSPNCNRIIISISFFFYVFPFDGRTGWMSSQSRRTPEFCTAFYWRNISKDRHVWARTRHSNIVTLFPRCHHIYLLSPHIANINYYYYCHDKPNVEWPFKMKHNSLLMFVFHSGQHSGWYYSLAPVLQLHYCRLCSMAAPQPFSNAPDEYVFMRRECTCVPLDELRCGNEWRRRQGGAEPDSGNDDLRTQAAGILACRCEWVLKHPVPCGQQHAIASPAQKYCWILRVAGPVPMFHTLHNSTFICFFLLSMHASLSLSRYIYK